MPERWPCRLDKSGADIVNHVCDAAIKRTAAIKRPGTPPSIASDSILLILIAPRHKDVVPQSASSSVFFETTTVRAASCAFEWFATHERPATRKRPTAYDVASTHGRAAADEGAGSHEIAKRPRSA